MGCRDEVRSSAGMDGSAKGAKPRVGAGGGGLSIEVQGSSRTGEYTWMQRLRQEATLNIGLLNAGVRSRDNAGMQRKGRGSIDITPL